MDRQHKLMRVLLLLGGLLLAGGAGAVLSRQLAQPTAQPESAASKAAAVSPQPVPVLLAAPARIEGASETIHVGAGVDGVLAAVLVREGQTVSAGQPLALVDCRDDESRLGEARAAIEIAKQKRERLLRGSRDEERRIAHEQELAAKAALHLAQTQQQRMRSLYATGDVAKERLDLAEKEATVAQAAMRGAQQHLLLVNAQPLPEELARVEAELSEAEARLHTTQAKLGKCQIKAPQAGTVLRIHTHPGEVVSTLNPQPVLVLADTSRLFARAEVDERDLGQLILNQTVLLRADALAGQTCRGHVQQLGQLMGRKHIRSGDPAEKSDRDVLEVLIELAGCTPAPPIGLRVTAQFMAR
jgi:multidrug resistance efflux pump